MAAQSIEIVSPYVLQVGQGLFEQPPFDKVLARVTRLGLVEDQSLKRALIIAAAPANPTRLEAMDDEAETALYFDVYQGLSYPLYQRFHRAINKIGKLLSPYPDYLEYLRDEPDIAYAEDGSWIYPGEYKHRPGTTIMYGPMDTARTYAYWECLRQDRQGTLPDQEEFLRDHQVTGLLTRYFGATEKALIGEYTPKTIAEKMDQLGPRVWKLAVNSTLNTQPTSPTHS